MKNVFVSSTFSDLSRHREAVRNGIRQLGLVDVSMEHLGARDQRPKDECLRLVRDESDLFVGIYAHRYGFVPPNDIISITESEYEAATLADIPRFLYLVDDEHPWRPADVDKGEPAEKLAHFKERLLTRHICRKFTTEDKLTAGVVADLGRHIAMRETTRVAPGLDLPNIGLESAHVPATETPGEWNELRNGIYDYNRNVFLAHVIEQSKKPNQEFDVYIYLIRHHSGDLEDIRLAEFFLGKYWENRVFPAILHNGFIGISTSAYGTFLCTCKVTFTDGYSVLLHRYIDFESKRQGA